MSTIRAVCLRRADLPDIFGPVIIIICWFLSSRNTSFAIYSSPGGSCCSITGMPSVFYIKNCAVVDLRLAIVIFRQKGYANDRRQSIRAYERRYSGYRRICVIAFSTRAVKSSVSREYFFFGTKYFLLILFEFLGNISFCADQGLFPDPAGGTLSLWVFLTSIKYPNTLLKLILSEGMPVFHFPFAAV
jgi:hypothetical protein